MDEFDREPERQGHRFVRYADDCNVYVRNERAGQRVMKSVTRLITQKLKLKVNEAKSAVARPQSANFSALASPGAERCGGLIAPKALERFKQRIRDITRRAKGVSMKTPMAELARMILTTLVLKSEHGIRFFTTASFDIVRLSPEGKVGQIAALTQADIWINGGFFVFRKEIFRYINPGDELVRRPFQRLIEKGALLAHKCTGFWQCMDTFKDKQCLEELNQGKAPWKVWIHTSTVTSNELATMPG